MARRLTQAQLARELEVSRQAIHKHVVAGTLAVGEDGLIDPRRRAVDSRGMIMGGRPHRASIPPSPESTCYPSP